MHFFSYFLVSIFYIKQRQGNEPEAEKQMRLQMKNVTKQEIRAAQRIAKSVMSRWRARRTIFITKRKKYDTEEFLNLY